MIQFSEANSKLKKLQAVTGRTVFSFDLLSGHTCLGAKDCFTKVVYDWLTDTYSLFDGPDQEFRCYAASQEQQYTGVYNKRLENWTTLKRMSSPNMMAAAIEAAMPNHAATIRIHSGGDFFSMSYFKAWILVAKRNPLKRFYAYTKFLPAWVKFMGIIPANLILTASRGGRYDHLIDKHGLREAKVIYDESEANGLAIDVDDSIAADPDRRNEDFCLVIHGQGPKNSLQSLMHASRRKHKNTTL